MSPPRMIATNRPNVDVYAPCTAHGRKSLGRGEVDKTAIGSLLARQLMQAQSRRLGVLAIAQAVEWLKMQNASVTLLARPSTQTDYHHLLA